MADNATTQSTAPATLPASTVIAARSVTYSGDTSLIAPVGLVAFSGADDAKTAADLPGDATYGLDVDVTRVTGTVTVSGPLTDTQMRATAVPVSGPLTDTQLRATAVPISDGAGSITIDDGAGSITVDAVSLPLPSGASTSALQGTANTSLGNIDTKTPALVTGRVPVDGSGVTQPVSGVLTNTELRAASVDVAVASALPAGTNAIGKLAANSGVDIGDVDITSVTPGTAATSLGKAEDVAHASGDVGVMALAVRKDTAAATAGTDGDYQPLVTDASGRLHVTLSGTIRASWGSKTAIAVTALASVASGSAAQTAAVDFGAVGAIDAVLRVTTKGQAGSTAALNIYAYAGLGDTTYTDSAAGTDSAFTAANRLNSRFVGAVTLNTTTAVIAAFSLAAAFDGVLPSKVGLILVNNSGGTMSATGGDHVVEYQALVLAA